MALSTISTISSHIMISTDRPPTLQMERQTVTESGTVAAWFSSCISNDGSNMYGGCAYGNGSLFKYDNVSSWNKIIINQPNYLKNQLAWRSIACNDSGTKLMACLEANHVYVSNDSGINWTQFNIIGASTTADWRGVAMDSTENIVLVCGGTTGNIHLSTNGGSSWTQITTETGWRAVAVSKNGQHMMVVRTSNVYISHDGGVNWTSIIIASSTFLTCCIGNNGNGYVAGNGSIFRRLTYNSSTGVTSVGGPISAIIGPIPSLACNEDCSRIIAVNNLTTSSGRVVLSLDSGATWTNIQTDIDAQFGSLLGWWTCAFSANGSKFILGQGFSNGGNMIIGTLA